MSDKKHIDRLFQEKFKDFEVQPNPKVWKNIEKQLQNSSTQKPIIIPFWQKATGIAAVLLIALIGSFALLDYNNYSNKIDVVNASNKNSENTSNAQELIIKPNATVKTNSSEEKLNKINLKNKLNNSSTKNKTQLNSERKQDAIVSSNQSQKSKNNSTINNQPKQKNTASSSTLASKSSITNTENKTSKTNLTNTASNKSNSLINYSTNNKSSLVTNRSDKVSNSPNQNDTYSSSKFNQETSNSEAFSSRKTSNLIALQKLVVTFNDSIIFGTIVIRDAKSIEAAIEENKKNFKKELIGNRWTMAPNIAPVYYNSIGKGSQFGSQFTNNNISGEINTSYGLKVGYALSDKFSIRSGVSKLNLSYDTDDVIVFENFNNTPSAQTIDNINFNNSDNLMVSNGSNVSVLQISGSRNYNAALSQRINYIEIPMELEYKLNDKRKKFGVNLIGGFSTFILEDNQVISEFDGDRDNIGKATNINDVSFSTNIGIGLNYKFSKSFVYNLEPTFKYQINGFSNTTGNFNPYIIGVYTGFSYKF